MSSPSLNGRRVLVPRGKKNAKRFSSVVENYGGIPIEVPLLDFRPIERREHLTPILETLHTYDWIIFTSDITVETFLSIAEGKESALPKVAVIGEKTKEATVKRNIDVHFMPHEYVAEGFSEEFATVVKPGEKMLIPKGNLARDYIARFFTERGHVVDEAVIYETFFPEEYKERLTKLLKEKSLDVLPFTSPSTIEHFMDVVKENGFEANIKDCIIAAIGPVSKRKCEMVGLKVDVMPEVYTSDEMIKAVAEFVSSKN